ncbi:OprD family outer membrane porin [Pseudomonas sp. 273]
MHGLSPSPFALVLMPDCMRFRFRHRLDGGPSASTSYSHMHVCRGALIRPAAGGRAQSAGWRAFRTGRWARGGRCRWSSTSTAAAILARRGDNTAWGLLGGHGFGPQWIGLGYQQVDGDSPFGYVTRGAIFLGNAVQLSDFHALNTISTSRPLVPAACHCPRPMCGVAESMAAM